MSDVAIVFNSTGITAPAGATVSLKNNVLYGNKKDGDTPAPQRY
jgi:hypothetical protein